MVRAREKWSRCMQSKGYRYQESGQIDEYLLQRFRQIVGPWARSMITVPPATGARYDRVALAALQREEVKVVNADLECEQREIMPVERTVRPQYEDEFRRQNKALLVRVPPAG
jgi:hypothetical protein